METLKHPACTLGWVARLCRSWLSPGKATRISHGRNPIWRIQLLRKYESDLYRWLDVLCFDLMAFRGIKIQSRILCQAMSYPAVPFLTPRSLKSNSRSLKSDWHLLTLFLNFYLFIFSTSGILLVLLLDILDKLTSPIQWEWSITMGWFQRGY